MKHRIGTLALAAVLSMAAVLASPEPALSQAAPQAKALQLSATAIASLDSMARVARQTHKENALCLTHYAVLGDSLALLKFGPATYTETDSVTIYADAPICPLGQPTIHSHLMIASYLWGTPSNVDLDSSAEAGVWGLLLVVPLTQGDWKVVLF